MSPKDFPTKEDVIKGIEQLKSHKWAEFKEGSNIESHVQQITDTFLDNFKTLVQLVQPIDNTSSMSSLNFYRVRPLRDFKDTGLICEYNYPPPHLSTKLQRCNYPSNPVFYCSNDIGAALMEVIKDQKISNDERFLVSKWSIIDTRQIKLTSYLSNNFNEQNDFDLGRLMINKFLESNGNNLTNSQKEGLELYTKYLAEIFTSDNNYHISAALAHGLLYSEHPLTPNILFYPSIQAEHKALNMAIHPNFVDNNMILEKIYLISVNNISTETWQFSINIEKYATIVNSEIVWWNIFPDDIYYMNAVKEDRPNYFNSQFLAPSGIRR